MSAELEQLAQYFREKGYMTVAPIVEAAAAHARVVGAPEYRGQPVPQEVFSEPNPTDERSFSERLQQVFDTANLSPEGKTLTPELAESINEAYGRHIADDVPIFMLNDLYNLRSKNVALGVARRIIRGTAFAQHFIDLPESAKAKVAIVNIRGVENSYITVGTLRELTPQQLSQIRGIGESGAQFILSAFRRAEPQEDTNQ